MLPSSPATSLEKALPEPPPREAGSTNDSTALTGGESRGTLPVDAASSATASATSAREDVIFLVRGSAVSAFPRLEMLGPLADGELPRLVRGLTPSALTQKGRRNGRGAGAWKKKPLGFGAAEGGRAQADFCAPRSDAGEKRVKFERPMSSSCILLLFSSSPVFFPFRFLLFFSASFSLSRLSSHERQIDRHTQREI